MNLFRVILFQSLRFPEIFRGKVDDLVLIVVHSAHVVILGGLGLGEGSPCSGELSLQLCKGFWIGL